MCSVCRFVTGSVSNGVGERVGSRIVGSLVAGSLVVVSLTLVSLIFLAAGPAAASVHLMQVEQFIGGVDGDPAAQAVQLRMRSSSQTQLQFSRLIALDATGSNPVVLINFPSSVPEGASGSRILVTTAAFDAQTSPPAVPDFTFSNAIPESYLASGSLVFENDSGTQIYWRVCWGGAGYTGPTDSILFNFDDGDAAPPWPDPIQFADGQSLIFPGAATDLGTTNAADYLLSGAPAVFTNNAGEDFTVVGASSSVGSSVRHPELSFSAFPNPFTDTARFRIDLPQAASLEFTIVEPSGRVVARYQDMRPAGVSSFEWDGRDQRGRLVAPGVYTYVLTAGGRRGSGRLVHVR